MGTRVLGLDLARFLAIAGMVVAHTVPDDEQGPVAGFLVNGNASTLFALASGTSAVLASRRYLAVGEAGRARVSLAIRGACLILLGLLLGSLPQQAVIVLVYLGAALLLAVPFLTAPRWVLIGAAALLAVVVPPLNVLARQSLDVFSDGFSVSVVDVADPVRALRTVLLTGTYPALTWLVYILAGMLVGRALVLRDEHDADGRHHRVVRRIGVRERLGVTDLEVDLEPLGSGAGARLLDELRDVVEAGHATEPSCGDHRDVTGAGGDVEHVRPGGRVDLLDEAVGQRDCQARDVGVVTAAPRAVLRALEAVEAQAHGVSWCWWGPAHCAPRRSRDDMAQRPGTDPPTGPCGPVRGGRRR